jgi:S-DNA-T family DNA segregation ATPase FtsK/SpoIIIE
VLPSLDLLKEPPAHHEIGIAPEAMQANARLLETVLSDYGVQGAIVEIRPGPVVTLYELEPAPGIRSARVIGLADDVARSLSVTAVRIATVPGRNVIGIEVPNAKRETVFLRELLSVEEWGSHSGRLPLALGKDIGGAPVIVDLARMPHLLVAGTTGSGKSVGINAMILSLLFRLSPEDCRLILIDPKMLELSVYDGIPHLMAPVVTEPAKAVTALKWTVREMERRYRAMSQLSVRNIGGYNERVAEARARGEVVTRRVQTGFDAETGRPIFEEQPLALEPLPFLVVVIDEMADLMMVAGKEIEAAVQRLAQMARAAGIHVIMATQRPSVDVITGTIKANFPTRISFQVISKFDSRTILGEQGSEQLLGQGDMLYMAGGGRITRVHGPFVGDREVEDAVAFLRQQGEPNYLEEVTEAQEESGSGSGAAVMPGAGEGEKGLFDQAVALVAREGKASTSFIQRHLQIGYNRAARLIEQMEKEGIVGPANHVGKREVLVRRTSADDDE